jgi:hypothetical protein
MMIWQEECQAKGQIKIYYPLKVQLIMVFWHEKQISLNKDENFRLFKV